MRGLTGSDGVEAEEGAAGRSTLASNGATCVADNSEKLQYEAVVVCSVVRDRKGEADEASNMDVVSFLTESFEAAGLKVEVLEGMDHKVFIKVAATDVVIGRAAETLQLKKLTNLGLQTVFDWELRESFMRQPHDQALFSWTERYYLLHHIIHCLKLEANEEVEFEFTDSSGRIACVTLAPGILVLSSLEEAGLVVDVFPSHDEQIRKGLLHGWSLNWSGGTSQPLDAIYSYFGPKIALYFAFLEMYTNWLIFPAVTGTLYFLVDLGKWSPVIPPLSAVTMVSWAALFLQFWKRRNLSILERWELRLEEDEIHAKMPWDNTEDEPLVEQHAQPPNGLSSKGVGIDPSAKQALKIEEWTDRVIIVRNIAIVFLVVMLFQIPFELLYAAFSQRSTSTIAKVFSISCYLFCIQKFKVIGGKLAVRLNNAQAHVSSEAAADSLIYKVFWIYFVQSYIGVFYHAFVLQDFKLLRQTLIDRMLVAQVINNVMESLVPYISYLYASRRTYNSERKEKKANGENVTFYSTSRVEKEFLKPRYITNIADDQHEGLFDDYLELALQFGIVVMFASFFPLVAVLALLNNLVEIRSDSFKLLEMMKRPVPHVVGSIGAWLHIFQYLSGAAIVSNCFLLLLMFDKDGEWRMDPGLAGVLVLEHALLAARFGLSWFVPEVPAWVEAKRRKRRRMQEGYSLHVLRSISKKMLSSRQSM